MKKRTLSIMIAALLGLSLLLSACASAPEPTVVVVVEPTKEPEPTDVPEPTEAPEVPKIVIWADETRSPIIEEVAALYADVLGIEVEVVQLGFGDIRDQIKVAGPAGEGPDIFIGAHDWLGELVANGLVAEVNLGAKTDSFFAPAVDAFSYGGTLYGMPYASENIAFFCNPDLLAEYGVSRPETWADVTAMSETIITASGGEVAGWTIQSNDPYHMFPLVTAYGGYIFGYGDAGYDAQDVGLDSEGGILAANWLADMSAAGYVEAGVDYDVMHTLFEQGQVACIGTGPWALSRIRESGVAYEIGQYPAGDDTNGRPFLGVQGFMVSAFSENQLLAQTLLQEVVATDQFMQAFFDIDPRPSAWLPVRDATADPDLAAFAAAGSEGLAMPAIPEMSAVWSAAGNAEELIISGELGGEEAFMDAAEQIRTAIAEGN